jgi:SAM-dependent methyltransferase
MLKRATRKGLNNRIAPHRSRSNTIGVETQVDFVLAFWMIHEVPDPGDFFRQIVPILKPSAKFLYAEPTFHVSDDKYKEILASAHRVGLKAIQELSIRFSRAALLTAIK